MKRLLIAACVTAQLAGCSTQMTNTTNKAISDGEARLLEAKNVVRQLPVASPSGATTAVKGIWLGGKAIPFKHDLALPAIFYERKNFLFPRERMSLPQAAERFRDVTGIPVRIASDVASTEAPASPTAVPAMPALPGASAVPLASQINVPPLPRMGAPDGNIVMNQTTMPAAMLDHMVAADGLSWEYKEGVVTIHRLVTRTFAIKATPGETTFSTGSNKKNNSEAGSSGGGSGGSISTGFASENSTATQGTMDPLKSIAEMVKLVLQPTGKVLPSSSTGTIVVIDTKEYVERAAKVIERENEILTRQAHFKVEVLSFTENNQDDSGVHISGIFSNLSKFGATLSAPTSVASATAGALGLNVLSGNGRSVSKFDGTRAVIQALAEYGKVATVHSVTVSARNRRQTPLAIQTQTVYLAQTTPGTASNGGVASAPGLTPGTVTTGFNIALQPNIFDSNQIALQMQIGLIDLMDMKTLTSGAGDSQQSIEAPQTGGFEFSQDVFLRPGETAILSGYERRQVDYNARKLSHELPFLAGGSFSGRAKKERIFILVTPYVVSNAN